jgi:hypothetical protein
VSELNPFSFDWIVRLQGWSDDLLRGSSRAASCTHPEASTN